MVSFVCGNLLICRGGVFTLHLIDEKAESLAVGLQKKKSLVLSWRTEGKMRGKIFKQIRTEILIRVLMMGVMI